MSLPLSSTTPPACPPSLPASPTTAAFGRQPVTTTPALGQLSAVAPADEPCAPGVGPAPGHNLALWSAPLLELVFRHLNLDDLVRCGQVCQQWHWATSDQELRAHCFLQAFTPWQRQQMIQALDAGQAYRYLSHWCGSPAAGATQPTALAHLAELGLSDRGVGLALLHSRIQTDRFSASGLATLAYRDTRIVNLISSPNGRYLAVLTLRHESVWSQSYRCLLVYRYDTRPLEPVGEFSQLPLIFGLRFSADSRRLQGIDKSGQLHRWHELDGVWHCLDSHGLSSRPVDIAVASPDGRCLAIEDSGRSLSLLREEEPGIWELHYLWQWKPGQVRPLTLASHRAYPMKFSDNSQSFLFVVGWEAFVCRRTSTGWQAHHFAIEVTQPADASLSPDGRLVALCSTRRGPRQYPGEQFIGLHLYRLDPQQRWQRVLSRDSHTLARRFPVSFSPNNQWLAFADGMDAAAGLRLLRTGAADLKKAPLVLPYGQAAALATAEQRALMSVCFSANSRYLTVCLGARVIFYGNNRGWSPLLWIPAPLEEPVRAVFAPDGYHCALAMGFEGEVSVWGMLDTGNGGQCYLRKHVVHQGSRLESLLFSPDGSRLVVGSVRHRDNPDDHAGADPVFSSRLSCLHLLPRAPGETDREL